jgi:circadian clock protein KaiC
LQLLADTPLRYRRQVLALKQFFASRSCTVMLLDDRTAAGRPAGAQHRPRRDHAGPVRQGLWRERRRVRVVKYRGIAFRGGLHDYESSHGGLCVYPRLVAAESRVHGKDAAAGQRTARTRHAAGRRPGGGHQHADRRPPGTGKSSLAAQFVTAAAKRGQSSAMFLFEEAANNLLNRADGLGMPKSASPTKAAC